MVVYGHLPLEHMTSCCIMGAKFANGHISYQLKQFFESFFFYFDLPLLYPNVPHNASKSTYFSKFSRALYPLDSQACRMSMRTARTEICLLLHLKSYEPNLLLPENAEFIVVILTVCRNKI